MPEKLPLSATIICKNEQGCIAACISSLDSCAEIVVVDSGSTDSTLDIVRDFLARGWPIKLIEHEWLGYAKQKQFALEQATQDWVVSIDADERLDDALRADLPRLLAAPADISGWQLRRTITLFGPPGKGVRAPKTERILRLARRKRVHFTENLLVHEGMIADGPMGLSRHGYLLHESYNRLDFQMSKQLEYSRLKVRQRIDIGTRPSTFKLFFNPLMYFIRYYFFYGMALCGIPGFIHSVVAAIYSFETEALHFQMWMEEDRDGTAGKS